MSHEIEYAETTNEQASEEHQRSGTTPYFFVLNFCCC